ncbi:hypothetical protein GOP47_0010849, partial [Adiantum capillus-veneris]
AFLRVGGGPADIGLYELCERGSQGQNPFHSQPHKPRFHMTSADHGRRLLPKFKGVRRRHWGRWVAEIRVPSSKDRLWLGSYRTAQQAARAYDVASACLRGYSTVPNLPALPLPSAHGTCLSPTSIRSLAAQEAALLSPRHTDRSESVASFCRTPLSLYGGGPSTLTPAPLASDEVHLASSHCDACLDVQAHPEQQPPSAADDESPSLVDLCFCLDLGPTVGPRLKALLTRSLHPEEKKATH